MKKLSVSLAYTTTDFDRRRGPEAGLALPVKALDADGSVLAEGAVSVDRAVSLDVPDSTDTAFVRLTWPSGRSETQRVELRASSQAAVTFSDSRIAPNEWSAWAIPKLNPHTPLARASGDVDLGLDRFARVWLRLWKFEQDAWVQEKLSPDARYRNGAAWQIDLSLSAKPWLLQVGGSQVTWRFVALPGGGPARVLITPKDSKDPRADELKVIVTSFRADAETLLEFLARDAMRAVDALANSAALATQLFAEKFSDPLSAVAGAYYLLRSEGWNRVPLRWFENLSEQFEWLPDAAIVHCIRLLREGPEAWKPGRGPYDLFVRGLERGWPVYSEGVTLLQEAATSLRGTYGRSDPTPFERAQAIGAAKAWAGAAASFYGRSPEAPSTLQWVGMPKTPRRRRLDPALASPRRSGSLALGFAETELVRRAPTKPARQPVRAIEGPGDDEFLLGSITR